MNEWMECYFGDGGIEILHRRIELKDIYDAAVIVEGFFLLWKINMDTCPVCFLSISASDSAHLDNDMCNKTQLFIGIVNFQMQGFFSFNLNWWDL